jgi:hypothetical protein
MGITINAVANLQKEHLGFLNNPDCNQIIVPEAKTGNFINLLVQT